MTFGNWFSLVKAQVALHKYGTGSGSDRVMVGDSPLTNNAVVFVTTDPVATAPGSVFVQHL